jgi:L-tyrosine isonitrile synthase
MEYRRPGDAALDHVLRDVIFEQANSMGHGDILRENTTAAAPAMPVSHRVLNLLYRYQRIDESLAAEYTDERTPCTACFEARTAKMECFIERHKPIHFVVPAFPAKSPNRRKVLSALPDLGESMALQFLQSLCDYIGHFYAPGARVTICSDGHVFGDVVGVTDTAVTAYREFLTDAIRSSHWSSLDLFGLRDAFGGTDFSKMRRMLEENYSATLEELRESVRTDATTRALFNGIHRFMFEDAVARRGGEAARTKLRTESKEAAYQTILPPQPLRGPAYLTPPSSVVDFRIHLPHLLTEFVNRGGDVVIGARPIEELAPLQFDLFLKAEIPHARALTLPTEDVGGPDLDHIISLGETYGYGYAGPPPLP